MTESGKRRAHLAQRREQSGFKGTGLLQQEQEFTTPHLRVNGRGCEAKRQSSGVTEPWSFKRLLLRGFLGPGRECEWAARAERESRGTHQPRRGSWWSDAIML